MFSGFGLYITAFSCTDYCITNLQWEMLFAYLSMRVSDYHEQHHWWSPPKISEVCCQELEACMSMCYLKLPPHCHPLHTPQSERNQFPVQKLLLSVQIHIIYKCSTKILWYTLIKQMELVMLRRFSLRFLLWRPYKSIFLSQNCLNDISFQTCPISTAGFKLRPQS